MQFFPYVIKISTNLCRTSVTLTIWSNWRLLLYSSSETFDCLQFVAGITFGWNFIQLNNYHGYWYLLCWLCVSFNCKDHLCHSDCFNVVVFQLFTSSFFNNYFSLFKTAAWNGISSAIAVGIGCLVDADFFFSLSILVTSINVCFCLSSVGGIFFYLVVCLIDQRYQLLQLLQVEHFHCLDFLYVYSYVIYKRLPISR